MYSCIRDSFLVHAYRCSLSFMPFCRCSSLFLYIHWCSDAVREKYTQCSCIFCWVRLMHLSWLLLLSVHVIWVYCILQSDLLVIWVARVLWPLLYNQFRMWNSYANLMPHSGIVRELSNTCRHKAWFLICTWLSHVPYIIRTPGMAYDLHICWQFFCFTCVSHTFWFLTSQCDHCLLQEIRHVHICLVSYVDLLLLQIDPVQVINWQT